MIKRQNYFSRTRENDLRMGAYYTDVAHCRSIGEMFEFPEEEVSVLEPSIGDGAAVLAVTQADKKPNIKIFGVELNAAVAEQTAQNPNILEVLKADFLDGTRIRKQSFSFCFGNPPYQNDTLAEGGTERVEQQFLLRVTELLSKEALLVWVIPYRSFMDQGTFRFLHSHYEVLSVYRFRPEEYAKFHQVVIVARKNASRKFLLKDELDAKRIRYAEEDIPVLPEHPLERYQVLPSLSDDVTIFSTKEFDASKAMEKLHGMAADPYFEDLHKLINKKVTQKPFCQGKAGRPPIPPKKDTLYLLATSGYGAGITGSEENHDVHLQRGVAEVIQESVFEKDKKNPEKMIEKVTSRTQITMTVIENDGKITTLE